MTGSTAQPALFSDAVQAVRLGQKMLAREILTGILHSEPRNEHAFSWMAALADTREEAIRLLEQVLEINPHNSFVSNALGIQRLNRSPRVTDTPISSPVETAAQSACPVCAAPKNFDAPRCAVCGAAASLDHLPSVLAQGGANERRVEEAIRALLDKIEAQPAFDTLLGVGLGYLSIHRSGDALAFLKRALQFHRNDSALRATCDRISQRKLILAVDDSPTVRRLVSISLERQGHRVRTAVDGLDGLAKFEEETPDLVLLDLTMPKMDGYELCKTLRRTRGAKSLPILMLSGNDGVFDKVRGKMAGATDYLTKPFQQDVLLQALSKFLQSAETTGKPVSVESTV